MQVPRDTRYQLTRRRAVKEVILLAAVFFIALALFFGTLHFIAAREVDHELHNRPWGLMLGWLTTMIVGLIVGHTRREEEGVSLPKSLVIIRELLQAVMLLLFFVVLAYGSYFVYTSRGLIVQRPWGILIGWFAFLMFTAFFVKTSVVIRIARRK